jgi:multiple sugar transport system permease protein
MESGISKTTFHILGQIIWKIFRFILFVCLTFVILYPLIYMVSMAFRAQADVFDTSVVWIPRSFVLDNIALTIKSINYFKILINTVFLSGISSIIQLVICSFIGYGFGRFKFPLRNLMLVVLLFTIIVPPQLISLPTFFTFKSLDFFGIISVITGNQSQISILDNPLSFFLLSFFGQGIRSGLFILIFRQFYMSMPLELENAAAVDGAGIFKTYFRIMLPNSITVSIVVFLFSLVWYWNDYYLTFIYLGNFRTLSTVIADLRPSFEKMIGDNTIGPYQMALIEQASCLLFIMPLLILYVITQKYFTESIEKTGIVG